MSTPFKDDTSYKDIEQHLRSHYHNEFGEPSNASELWRTLEGQLLPLQQKEMSWWQRCLQVFAPVQANSASTKRRAPARAALGFSLALVALVLVSGVFYTTGLVSFHQGQTTVVNNNASDTALLSALLQKNPQFRKLSYTNVNQQKSTNDSRINFQKAYADANNIVIAYTVDKNNTTPTNTPDRLTIAPRADVTITTPLLGNKLLTPTLTSLFTKQDSAVLAVFDASVISGNPGTLPLNVTIKQGSTVVKFNLTVTFTAGKTITVNKSATSHGVTMTLNRVVITPTETRFYTSNTDKSITISSLDVNGTNVSNDTSNMTINGALYLGPPNSLVIIPGLWLDLRNDTGNWNVKMFMGDNIYRFAFNVA